MGIVDGLLTGMISRGRMSPIKMALLGLLAYRAIKGKTRLTDVLGGSAGRIGGLLGGAAGLVLSGGIADVVKQFQQSGQGEKADSWVSKGKNKPVSIAELELALGEERIAWLTQETGMPRQELLAGLSRELPEAVDELTPDGSIPNPQDADRILQRATAKA